MKIPINTPTTGTPPPWPPATHALTYHRLAHPGDNAPTSLLISHATAPYVTYLPALPDEKTLQKATLAYIEELEKHLTTEGKPEGLGLPKDWLEALKANKPDDKKAPIGWLPPDKPPTYGKLVTPLASFAAVRSADLKDKKADVDRTWILLAGEKSDGHFLGSGFGLRVIMHQRAEKRGKKQRIDITAMSAVLPYGRFREPEKKKGGPAVLPINKLIEKLEPEIEKRLNLEKLIFRGVRLYGVGNAPGKSRYAIRATAFGDPAPRGGSGACDVVAEGSRLKSDVTIDRLKKTSLTARAAHGVAPVFQDDPMSSLLHPDGEPHKPYDRRRRPTRSEETLDFYRDLEMTFPDGSLETSDFQIKPSRFVRADRGKTAKKVPQPGGRQPLVRSNDFAALSAFQHTKSLFDLMKSSGIDPDAYFRRAKRPLHVFYRSGVEPGPGKDGQTVNARVNRQLSDDDRDDSRPLIELHLALANLSHRDRAPWNGVERSQAEPLGIATAGRWMWHEFGHVLLIAALGELEFRFAHSPGDALAAILADPHSRLAEKPNEHLRGYTFPWTYPRRRHDRLVQNGWAWGGTMNPAGTVASGNVIKGYRAEQILSTTLFRLYRCLGGDTTKIEKDKYGNEITVPDRDAREAAAHYTIFLIMRALQLAAFPPLRIEDFVDLLIQADIGTTHPFVAPLRSGGKPPKRIGGTVHKLIRWAFEAQGLYQTQENPTTPINAPGQPPAVDIFIADQRMKTDRMATITYDTPGYVPVSLDWKGEPAWHATDQALHIDKDQGKITVNVENRGRKNAEKVKVKVWWRKVPTNLDDLEWNQGKEWTQCDPPNNKSKEVPANGFTAFGPFTNLPSRAGKYAVFAEATCPNDRANNDQATSLPCSMTSTPLIDLVAGDNNLGLRIHVF